MNDETGDHGAESPVADVSGQGVFTDGEPLGRRLNVDDLKTWNRKRRLDFLDDMIRALDILIYAQIATVYYVDNSFLRFALRCLVQLIYLMPRTSPVLPDPPSQPYVGGILGSNVLCLFCHLYFARPSAGEATRGYMHGGLMLDFVGQLGPTSKLHLVLLDAGILLLQLAALSATLKRRELAKASRGGSTNAPNGSPATGTEDRAVTGQDHDAEEQGVLRRASAGSAMAESSESQSLLPEAVPASGSHRPGSRALHRSDLFWSGQSTVAELYLWDTIKEAPNAASPISTDLQAQLQRRGWQLNLPFRS